MVRQVLSPVMLAAFVDEMTKIAARLPSPGEALRRLRSGPFSTNIGKPSSIRMTMPSLRSAPPPPVGRVTTVGGSSIATQTPGVNLRKPATAPQQPMQNIQSSVAPASPSYVSPQVNVQAAPTMQGKPQITQASPLSTGGGAGQVAPPAVSAQGQAQVAQAPSQPPGSGSAAAPGRPSAGMGAMGGRR